MKETIYEKSENIGLVDFAYLAINDEIIVNKTIKDDCGLADNFSFFDNEILLKLDSDEGTLTALITFEDTKEWESSLQKTLVDMVNNNQEEDVIDNEMIMFYDALYFSGFDNNTLIYDLVQNIVENLTYIYHREVDFKMHYPTMDDIHPGYDT